MCELVQGMEFLGCPTAARGVWFVELVRGVATRVVGVGICSKIGVLTFFVTWSGLECFEQGTAWLHRSDLHSLAHSANTSTQEGLGNILTGSFQVIAQLHKLNACHQHPTFILLSCCCCEEEFGHRPPYCC
ncbi:hypothetical protein Drorol1_Dr00004034 [Drosera rotundifolia]